MAIEGALKEEGRKEKALTWGAGLSAGASRGALGSGSEGVGPRGGRGKRTGPASGRGGRGLRRGGSGRLGC